MIDASNLRSDPAAIHQSDIFKTIRKSVMYEHVLRQKMPWNEENENLYHEQLFAIDGLNAIYFEHKVIGFIGVRDTEKGILIDRLCIEHRLQKMGVGTWAINNVLRKYAYSGKIIYISSLRENPVRRLFERLGFSLIEEDENMSFYEKHLSSSFDVA